MSTRPNERAVFQIANGVGSGNIGDEMMARAFWDALPPGVRLTVARFPEHARQREPYRGRPLEWVEVDWSNPEGRAFAHLTGLLVGDTPVCESEGLHYPMQFLAPRLEAHQAVHAVGVGVDPLRTPEAIAIFRRSYLPVRSWTVRSEACRDALLELGVEPARIRVGADWAWLCRAASREAWAAEYWRGIGIDPSRPLLVANVVNMHWDDDSNRRAIGAALDLAQRRLGLQVAFFANETRDGAFFDHAAARQVRAFMSTRAAIVPNEAFSPGEALGLLSHATVTVSQRYHFSLMSAMSGAVPVNLVRGQKMRGLAGELGLEPAGTVERVGREELFAAVADAVRRRAFWEKRIGNCASILRERAAEYNLSFPSSELDTVF